MSSIPIHLNITLIVIFAIFGIAEGRRLFYKHKTLTVEKVLKIAPYLYILLSLSFVFLALSFFVDQAFLWNLPLWLDFYYLTLMWGGILSIFAFIFSLASYISFRTNHHEKWKIALSSFLLISAIQVTQWNYCRLVASDLEDITDPSGLIMQTSGSSCAAASAANIVRIFDIRKTEKEMSLLFHTTTGGTTAAHIIYGMRTLGFSCKKVEIKDYDIKKLRPPAMIFIDHPSIGKESHAAAFINVINGNVEIWDPLEGKKNLDRYQLQQIWHGRGIEFRLDNKIQAY